MAITATELHRLYLAYFGRPADFDGFMYYTNDPNITLQSAAAAFSNSPESKALYGEDFGADQINRIYLTLFNREAEPAGLAYWLGEVASGRLPPAEAAYGILVGAQGADALTVANKLQVALAFYGELDTVLELIGYGGDDAAASARAFLARVEGTQGSLDDALAAVEDEVAKAIGAEGPGPGPGPDPELPAVLDPENPGQGDEPAVPVDAGPVFDQANVLFAAGADNLGGSDEADVFFGRIGGASATVQAGDKAHGQGDEDTLNLVIDELAEDSVPDFETEDVEVITVRNRSGELQMIDASNFKSALLFASDNSSNTLFFDNLAQGQAGGTLRDGMSTGAGLYFRYAEAATEAELRLSQAVNDSIAIGGAGIQTTRIRSLDVESGNSLAQLLVFGDAGEQIEIEALGSLEIAKLKAEAGGTRLVLEGDADEVVLGSLEGVDEVDAGEFTGILEIHGGDDAVFVDGFDFTGGSGSDTYHTRGVLTSGLVDAGDGVDVLAVHASEHITETTAGFYAGFEALQVHDGVSINASLVLGDARSVVLIDRDAAAGTAVTGLASGANLTVLEADGRAGAIALQGAGYLTLSLANGAGEADLGAIKIEGIVNLAIESDRDYAIEMSAIRLSPESGLEAFTASGVGDATVTIGNWHVPDHPGINGVPFDFSAVTGDVSFDARGLNTNAYAVEGSLTGANTFFGSERSFYEFLRGGAQIDHVQHGGANSFLRLGEGGDVVDMAELEGFSGGYVTIEIFDSSHSGVSESGTAFDPDLCDTISGLANAQTYVDEAQEDGGTGSRIYLDMHVAGTLTELVSFDDEVTFGATEVEQYGFFVLDASGSEVGTAYVFQDSNGSETIDRADIMVRLIGSQAFTSDEFSIAEDGGTLIFESKVN
jgi:hypothetical protein